jgi:hypothetical protein
LCKRKKRKKEILWWIRLSGTALPTTSDPMTRMVHGDEVVPVGI